MVAISPISDRRVLLNYFELIGSLVGVFPNFAQNKQKKF